MKPHLTRREFHAATAVSAVAGLGAGSRAGRARVVVWDERQPAQKTAYRGGFLGDAVAAALKVDPTLDVVSRTIDDPAHGLDEATLDACRVLVWWGHARQAEIAPEVGRAIVARIKRGSLSLVALHSAHWATPFVEAMNERSRIDLAARLAPGADVVVREIPPPGRYTVPRPDARLTPYSVERKYPDGKIRVDLHLPFCCFPSYRNDGKASQIRTLKPGHPIAAGLPATFTIEREEMYDEPFHVPEPDEVIFEERFEAGEWFRAGMLWTLGAGRVFYFRPGHETYPTYLQPRPLQVVANAVRWLAGRPQP